MMHIIKCSSHMVNAVKICCVCLHFEIRRHCIKPFAHRVIKERAAVLRSRTCNREEVEEHEPCADLRTCAFASATLACRSQDRHRRRGERKLSESTCRSARVGVYHVGLRHRSKRRSQHRKSRWLIVLFSKDTSRGQPTRNRQSELSLGLSCA